MRAKLNNLNSGFDPELFTIGTQMAVYHLEAGAKRFADYARNMINDLGNGIRPYLKSFYEGARQFPGMDNTGMDAYKTVKEFDIKNFNLENVGEENNEEKTPKKTTAKSAKNQNNPLPLFDEEEPINTKQNERTLQANSTRLHQGTPSGTGGGMHRGGTDRDSGLPGRTVSRADGRQQRPAERERSILSGDADVLLTSAPTPFQKRGEEAPPALVEFEAARNDVDTFNKSKKYADNISAIETLLTLLAGQRKATAAEKSVLSKYVGFGGLKEILLNPDADNWSKTDSRYKEQVRQIIELAARFDAAAGTTDTLQKIRGSILNAHYTSATVIEGIYAGLKKLGFRMQV